MSSASARCLNQIIAQQRSSFIPTFYLDSKHRLVRTAKFQPRRQPKDYPQTIRQKPDLAAARQQTKNAPRCAPGRPISGRPTGAAPVQSSNNARHASGYFRRNSASISLLYVTIIASSTAHNDNRSIGPSPAVVHRVNFLTYGVIGTSRRRLQLLSGAELFFAHLRRARRLYLYRPRGAQVILVQPDLLKRYPAEGDAVGRLRP